MVKTYCDKCGKEVDCFSTIDLPCDGQKSKWAFRQIDTLTIELCYDCLEKLKKWIDEED